MIGEGLFILAVSLSGDYTDMRYVSNFDNCVIAMQYFEEHCAKYKAASCTLQEYTLLPRGFEPKNVFSFDSLSANESMSCGFIGVETRNKFIKEE